jgi:hypothetical protein
LQPRSEILNRNEGKPIDFMNHSGTNPMPTKALKND